MIFYPFTKLPWSHTYITIFTEAVKLLNYNILFLKELFADEINQIRLILNKNGYPQELVNKLINLHLKSLKTKASRTGKRLLSYVNKSWRIIEKNMNRLISKSYHLAKPRVIFLSKPVIRLGGKNSISE